jgi:hypothetical protein
MPVRTSGPVKTAEQQEKLEAKENWYKLVVKIIVWKEGNAENRNIKQVSKITAKEWKAYCQGMAKTNLTYGKEKVDARLKETWIIINRHNGFE